MVVTKVSSITDTGYSLGKTYPYSVLVKGSGTSLPSEVDPSKKEQYLSNEEFQIYFKMDKETFASLAPWKQETLKRSAKLF